MVHEILHAYFNSIKLFEGYGIVADDTKPLLERLSNFAKLSSDSNGRDHLTILESYVDKIAKAVQESDPNSNGKVKEDYYKLAIGTLYNDAKVPSPDFSPTFNALPDAINVANNFSITLKIHLQRLVQKSISHYQIE